MCDKIFLWNGINGISARHENMDVAPEFTLCYAFVLASGRITDQDLSRTVVREWKTILFCFRISVFLIVFLTLLKMEKMCLQHVSLFLLSLFNCRDSREAK